MISEEQFDNDKQVAQEMAIKFSREMHELPFELQHYAVCTMLVSTMKVSGISPKKAKELINTTKDMLMVMWESIEACNELDEVLANCEPAGSA